MIINDTSPYITRKLLWWWDSIIELGMFIVSIHYQISCKVCCKEEKGYRRKQNILTFKKFPWVGPHCSAMLFSTFSSTSCAQTSCTTTVVGSTSKRSRLPEKLVIHWFLICLFKQSISINFFNVYSIIWVHVREQQTNRQFSRY